MYRAWIIAILVHSLTTGVGAVPAKSSSTSSPTGKATKTRTTTTPSPTSSSSKPCKRTTTATARFDNIPVPTNHYEIPVPTGYQSIIWNNFYVNNASIDPYGIYPIPYDTLSNVARIDPIGASITSANAPPSSYFVPIKLESFWFGCNAWYEDIEYISSCSVAVIAYAGGITFFGPFQHHYCYDRYDRSPKCDNSSMKKVTLNTGAAFTWHIVQTGGSQFGNIFVDNVVVSSANCECEDYSCYV